MRGGQQNGGYQAAHRTVNGRRILAGVTATAALAAALTGVPDPPAGAAGAGQPPGSVPSTRQTLLPVPAGFAAEATVAIDPKDPTRIAVADDPYLVPARIQLTVSSDGGQHWSAPRDVVPPGNVKSYDPQLGFTADGTLIVSGGASPNPSHGCQSSSSVFVAELREDQLSYHTVAAAPPQGLLDRPTLLVDPAGTRELVAWTASQGPGADCMLRPLASTTQVAVLNPQLAVTGVQTLPAVAPAPFGSAMALSGAGSVGLAVAARDGTDTLAITLYQSTDGAHWTPSPVARARATPDSLPGLGGDVLSMPSITGLGRGFAVAWTDDSTGTPATQLAVGQPGSWQQIPPPAAAGIRLLPTVAAGGGTLLLTEAGLSPAGLRFSSWQRLGDLWFGTGDEDGGAAADRQELGEVLGAAVAPDGTWATAAPVELPGSSAILVRTQGPAAAARPRAPRVATHSRRQHAAPTLPAPRAGSWAGRIGRSAAGQLALGAAAGLLVLAGWARIRRARRRARAGRRARGRPPATGRRRRPAR